MAATKTIVVGNGGSAGVVQTGISRFNGNDTSFTGLTTSVGGGMVVVTWIRSTIYGGDGGSGGGGTWIT